MGPQISIKRDYTATNAFGATLDGYYICTVNKLSQLVDDIQFRDGNY